MQRDQLRAFVSERTDNPSVFFVAVFLIVACHVAQDAPQRVLAVVAQLISLVALFVARAKLQMRGFSCRGALFSQVQVFVVLL